MIQAWYAHIYKQIERIAWRHGYALALHGTMSRDLDVVAIPWTEDASDQKKLIATIDKAIVNPEWRRSTKTVKRGCPVGTEKPHGRKAYAIMFDHDGSYVDISVMPRLSKSDLKKLGDLK